jgi:hypothetical protein
LRLIGLKPNQEVLERLAIPFHFDEDALSRIQHPTVKSDLGRKPVDEGTEAHTLDHSSDGHL